MSFDVVCTSGDWQNGHERGTETATLGTSRSAVGSSGSLNGRYPDLVTAAARCCTALRQW